MRPLRPARRCRTHLTTDPTPGTATHSGPRNQNRTHHRPPQRSPPHQRRRLAEALGALFAKYPASPDGADTLTLTITGYGGAPLQVDGDPGQFGWIADLVEGARSHDDHPDHGVCAHCGQHKDAVQV